jgi:DNA-binding response OmpR family regulator
VVIVLEIDTLTVRCGEDTQILPQKEFLLLYKMASEMGKIFTRVDLMQLVWGYENETDTHTVDVHIARLRERFKSSPDFKIETIRGVGYKVVKL